MSKPDLDVVSVFSLLSEIGIINQLATRAFEKRLPEGFLISHFSVVNHLFRLGDGRTPLSIANALQVPKTTMTHTLGGLSKAGLIVFEPNPKDSRSKCVMLTEAGRKFRADAIQAMGPDLVKVAQHVAPADIDAAMPMLQNLRRYLDAERDT